MINDWLVKRIKDNNFKSFIDIGCGKGVTAGEIKKALPYLNVKGIDIAEGHIEWAKEHYPDVKFWAMDLRKMTFKPKTFDVAHTNGVLIHVNHEEIEKVIAGIMRIAREGIFLESQAQEIETLPLHYDPKEYWNGRIGREEPGYIDQNTKYYFCHPYEKIFVKLELSFKVERDWKDKERTRLYRVW